MIGRADIEESKSDVAMDAWPPQASYPFGNFSVTYGLKLVKVKGSLGHGFPVDTPNKRINQFSFCPYTRREISVLSELNIGHLRYRIAGVPPQPNSPSVHVLELRHT